MRRIKFFLFLIFASVVTLEAWSFTLIFKDGRRVEGTWITETKAVVQVRDINGVVRTYHKSELDMSAMAKSSRSFAPKSNQPDQAQIEKATKNAVRDEDPAIASASISTPGTAISERTEIKPAPLDKVTTKRWAVEAGFSNVYESNINHDEEDIVESVGLVSSLNARFRNRVTDPNLLFRYEVGYHEYTNTEQWDRLSHNFRATHIHRFNKKFALENNGEIALNGSSEDRELGDTYGLRPILRYGINDSTQIDLMAAYRYRKFETGTTAVNRYAGVVLTKEFGDHEVTSYFRYEYNNSENPRNDRYVATYFAGYSWPMPWKTTASFGTKLRTYRYVSRLAEIEVEDGPDIEFLRRDKKWNFEFALGIPLGHRLELVPEYEYEYRTSNDPDKPYDAHEASLSLVYLLW